MTAILIKNGKVVTETEAKVKDILVVDDKIKKIDENIEYPGAEIIDATEKIVIPGGVDVHTHLNLHTGNYVAEDDFYTGTVAAACGGTTTIIDHPGFGPKGCSLKHQITQYHEYADNKAVIDYGFHGVFQHVDESILNEIPELIKEGITSFKAYLVYNYALNDRDILNLMFKLKESGGLLTVHCENNHIQQYFHDKFVSEGKTAPIYHAKSRNDICEAEAVNRMICLSSIAKNAPLYLVHVSAKASLDYIKLAHMSEHCVVAETCPQYLLLDEERYNEEDGLKYILTPPLRDNTNQIPLWNGINREYISTVGTDHCPFNYSLRKKVAGNDFSKCPNGLPGIETRIPLMFSEGVMQYKITLNRFVEVNCTNPAKVMGLYPQKGVLKEGSDADIVIIDPDKKTTVTNDMLHQNVDYTPFEGFELEGYPILTMSRGKIIAKDNKFIGKKGDGKFLKRKSPLFE
jgi:dihydropyrimidinase